MSTICLICKDKLLNSAPGSSVGSLNSLVENQVIATECGHLYHSECLQCWFRTQKKKLLNQGRMENYPDQCPTCQVEVHGEQIRRIYLLEDHREALEKARFLEKMENLEIYCHQLEVHVQRLQSENDLLLNKVLAPQTSHRTKDEFAAIVKNDRVMWLKKDSPPLSAIVLSICKKEGSLWVKIKLDKKIRTNQRSGLFGSFRFDKKQEWTVPFEEIVLEKEYQKNNITVVENPHLLSEPKSPAMILPSEKMQTFKSSSTMSLPGELLLQRNLFGGSGRVVQARPLSGYINRYSSSVELSGHTIPITEQSRPMPAPVIEEIEPVDEPLPSPENRDYVIFSPTSGKPLQSNGRIPLPQVDVRTSPQSENKIKHVTFAEGTKRTSLPVNSITAQLAQGNHFTTDEYLSANSGHGSVSDAPMMLSHSNANDGPTFSTSTQSHENEPTEQLNLGEEDMVTDSPEVSPTSPSSSMIPSVSLTDPSSPSTPCSSSSAQVDLQTDVFIDSYDYPSTPKSATQNSNVSFNQTCFDITLATLFYDSRVFDEVLFRPPNDHIQRKVHQVLTNEFANPIRDSSCQRYKSGYASHLHETISHLCSSYLDLEELMTILFEYVFKIPPFITYSYDMCDYIHQFFIDFTDKTKRPSVQQLFERSLSLQDNLKLCGEPSPALLLQMPNSDDGIIHYEAVIPSRTLNIEKLIEPDSTKTEVQLCYCNKVATLECSACAKVQGKSPVLFCEECCILLEAIHDQMYHKLDLVPIKAMSIFSPSLELAATICLKANTYSVFLRNWNGSGGQPSWKFVEDFNDGRPQIKILPKMEVWLDSLSSEASNFEIGSLDTFQRKLLTECRMFLYVPVKNSNA